jgi:hypothetical protein
MIRNLDNSDLFFPQDERISFEEDGHIYLLDGERQLTPVSSVYSKFFKPFDTDYWAERKAQGTPMTAAQLKEQWECNGQMASFAGTHLHKQIEEFINGDEYMAPMCRFTYDGEFIHEDKIIAIDKEIEYFHKFVEDVDFTPFRTEWRVFDEELGMAGTIDLICSRKDGTFEFYDWKRSRSLIDEFGQVCKANKFDDRGINGLEHIQDCAYWHYAFQQNLYKHIVEKCYGLTISAMHLVVLHPHYSSYRVIDIPQMPNEIKTIISDLKNMK